jgi:gas vesicle protein
MDRRNPNYDRMNGGSGGGSLLAGLMIGGLIGAGTMLLLAPQSGRKTREELQQGAIDLKDRATDTVRETASQVRSRTEDVVSNVRGKAVDLQNQGKDIAIDQLDKVASTAQSGKKAIQNSK